MNIEKNFIAASMNIEKKTTFFQKNLHVIPSPSQTVPTM
jgi:hypothetical protein